MTGETRKHEPDEPGRYNIHCPCCGQFMESVAIYSHGKTILQLICLNDHPDEKPES